LVCVDVLALGLLGVSVADELPMMPPSALLLPPPGATTVRVTVRPGVTWSDPHAVRTRAAAALSATTMADAERRRRDVRRRLTRPQYVSTRVGPAWFATSSQAGNQTHPLRVL
jgi:hypothetical protein